MGAGLLQTNAMVAGTDFTADNGATLVVPGNHEREGARLLLDDEVVHPAMTVLPSFRAIACTQG